MPQQDDHIGPALEAVRRGDPDGIAELVREQRARLAVVREHRLWDWFGGMPNGFGNPRAPLHSVYLDFACVVLVPVALIVAGFTRGPVLWIAAALALGCFLAARLVVRGPRNRTLAFYGKAVQVPGIVVGFEPEATQDDNELLRGVWALVSFAGTDADSLDRLVIAGDHLHAMVEGSQSVPSELQSFVDLVKADIAQRRADGSRVTAPAALGQKLELARVMINPRALPEAKLNSRLLFVFADPGSQAPGHSRMLPSSLWGDGVHALCRDLPLRGAA